MYCGTRRPATFEFLSQVTTIYCCICSARQYPAPPRHRQPHLAAQDSSNSSSISNSINNTAPGVPERDANVTRQSYTSPFNHSRNIYGVTSCTSSEASPPGSSSSSIRTAQQPPRRRNSAQPTAAAAVGSSAERCCHLASTSGTYS